MVQVRAFLAEKVIWFLGGFWGAEQPPGAARYPGDAGWVKRASAFA